MFVIGQIWRHVDGGLYKIISAHGENKVDIFSLRSGNIFRFIIMDQKYWVRQSPIEEYI